MYLMRKYQSNPIPYYDCNMANTFGDRVRERREAHEMSQEQLAKASGVSQSTIAQIESGRNKGTKHILKLATALAVRPEWLENGRGPMHKSSGGDVSINEHKPHMFGESLDGEGGSLARSDLPQPTEDEFAFVPQLDIAAACGNGRFEDHVVVKGGLAFKKSFLREQGVPEHSARIIYSDGGSMHPTIQDGRVVLINMSETRLTDGKIYAVCLPDGGLVLKRLVRDYHPAAGSIVWILRSDNPDKTSFPDKLLPPDDRTMIAGRAVWTDAIL